MSTLTQNRYDRIVSLPISLPQTELRRGRSIEAAVVNLGLGEELEVRSLTIHLVRILTQGTQPSLNNTALGLASAGVYFATMLTGGAFVKADAIGAWTWNPSAPMRFVTPGIYRVLVSNNASNTDLAVTVTGSIKWMR